MLMLVRVVLVSLLSGEQTPAGNWPRVYEHHEEGGGKGEVELYVMDLQGRVCTLATRGEGGGWVRVEGSREEFYAKFYATTEEASECPEEGEEELSR